MSILNLKLKSVCLNDIDDVTVILPDVPMRTKEQPESFYSSGKKFKVLWLLHGGRDTMRDWAYYSSIPRLAVQYGIMIVMPNGHDSDYVNHPETGDGFLFKDYFFRELMPFVHHWLPASPNPADNFLAGASMGCAATWQYAIEHPEKFGWICPMSNQPLDYRHLEPHRYMSTADFRVRAKADEFAFAPAYGGVGEGIHVKEINTICKYLTVGEFLDSYENTMPRLEEAIAAGWNMKAYIPCGCAPRDFKLKKFSEYCASQHLDNMKFEFFEEDTHCFEFWEKAVERFLQEIGIPRCSYFVGV
ncbi:MAG: hypothetical protein LUE16_00630 [Lachnospiraceae bacterium]|nr:hypothetical protein [Lachnospiraceae bacterium]